MAYGFEVSTTDGVRNLLDMLTAQLVFEQNITTQSGSASVLGGVNSSNAIAVCLPLDGKPPLTELSVGNGLVSWNLGAPPRPQDSLFTSNFTLRVYRIL